MTKGNPLKNVFSVYFLATLLCVVFLARQAQGQANYVDPFVAGRVYACPYFSTQSTNSGAWGDANSVKCSTNDGDALIICNGDKFHVSQCYTGYTATAGDSMVRVFGMNPLTELGVNDDACGEALGGFFTIDVSGYPSSAPCRNVTIVSGCFEAKACSGRTRFVYWTRVRRCGYGYYRTSAGNCAPVTAGK